MRRAAIRGLAKSNIKSEDGTPQWTWHAACRGEPPRLLEAADYERGVGSGDEAGGFQHGGKGVLSCHP